MTTKDQVAQLIVGEAKARNHTRDECLAELSCLYQESGWDETIWDDTHTTYGVAQQDGSYPHRFEGAAAQVKAFFDRLDVKRTSPMHGDIWENLFWLQQGPNWPSAAYAVNNPKTRIGYMTEIKSRIATVTPYLDKYWPTSGGVQPVTDPNRPDFNEINEISLDTMPHASVRSQPPRNFFLHTQQGDGNATDLSAYLRSTQGAAAVSYHYTVRQDLNDGGVTVVDVEDTDLYCWAVLSANVFSINLCFAGSYVEWTRDQWMLQSKAIDVAAYIAVQDSRKYNFSHEVIAPPYGAARQGISDHKYVTQVLGIGTHSDVGPNFPWDLFAAAVLKYAGEPATSTPVPTTPPPATAKRFPDDYSDHELIQYVAAQMGPGDPSWPSKGMTMRDKVWTLATPVAKSVRKPASK